MRVQVNARNRAYEFDAEPGEKILFAGLRADIDLPYECAHRHLRHLQGAARRGTHRGRLAGGAAARST